MLQNHAKKGNVNPSCKHIEGRIDVVESELGALIYLPVLEALFRHRIRRVHDVMVGQKAEHPL
jgi:hypothetical protein